MFSLQKPRISLKNRVEFLRYSTIALFIIAILLIIFLFFAPFQTHHWNNKSETTIYFADIITPMHQRLIDIFNKENKGHIKVIAINLDYHKLDTNKRKELITRNLRSQRSKIDIFAIDNIWMPRFAKWAEPLTAYLTDKKINKIRAELLSSCYYENELYTVPFFYDLGVMFYREDLIKQLPDAENWINKLENGITWQQLIELKKKYFNQKPLYVFQGKAYEGLICNYLEIGAGLGIKISDENNFIFKKPDILRLNNFLLDLIYKENLVPEQILQFDEHSSFMFALENNIPLIRAWVTDIFNINFPEKYRDKVHNLKMAPLPRDENRPIVTALGGWNLIISKYSRHKKEAALFIGFLISEKAQFELFAAGSHLPVLDLNYRNNGMTNAHLLKPLSQEWIKTSIRRPLNKDYTRLSDIYSELIHSALQGRITTEQLYNLATKRIK